METPGPQTSFIPKRVLTAEPPPHRRFFAADILLTFSAIVLGLCLLFYAGTYFYKYLLYQTIHRPCSEEQTNGDQFARCGLLASVEREEKNLNRETILMLQRLDRKFKLVGELGQSHLALLPVFRLLEELTLPTIAYQRFSYAGTTLKLEGEATKYEDLAVQGDIFLREAKRIRDFVFSDLNLDASGNVVFKLALKIDPSVISYLNNLTAR